MDLLNDFLRYVSIDTQSSEESETTPSTLKQLDLLNLLKNELTSLGLEAELDQYGRLYSKLDGNNNYETIGLCAHVDTALECSGANVKPQIISNYDLSDIKLGNSGLVLSKSEFPYLNKLKGKTLITTDGTTLLGADDKAGVAIIISVVKELIKSDPNHRHPMAILFTPDEEVGRGPEHFDVKKYGAKYAYTIDGANARYISYENFNAASATISIIGKSIHPGDAKNTMINASLVANSFINKLDPNMIPSKTEGYEGFNHLCYMEGGVEKATLEYIIRNHDANKLEEQIVSFNKALEDVKKEYPHAQISLIIKHQYRNMAEIINKNPEAKNKICQTYEKMGLEYEFEPIRGGTDGATFSFLGCPCPNLGTGSYNHHGRYEFAVLEEMEDIVKILKELFTI